MGWAALVLAWTIYWSVIHIRTRRCVLVTHAGPVNFTVVEWVDIESLLLFAPPEQNKIIV